MPIIRTCVGCRATDEKAALVRVVAVDGLVVVDEHQTMPGRGAYLHARSTCLEAALRRRVFRRALRTEVDASGIAMVSGWSSSSSTR